MKTNFRKLRLMIALGVINPEWFYCITVVEDKIELQGHLTSEKVQYFFNLLGPILPNKKYIEFERSNIIIVLT